MASSGFAGDFHDTAVTSEPIRDAYGDKLFGGWGGLRTGLADHGLTITFDTAYSYQNVLSGGTRFGRDEGNIVSGNLSLVLDTDKAGLWPGGYLTARVEGRDGLSVLTRAGATSPVNNDALLPLIPGTIFGDGWGLTELHYAQFFDEHVGLMFGLLNTDTGDENPISGYLGSNQHFMNAGLLFSPVAISTVPNVTLGGGLLYLPSDANHFKFLVLGTNETAGLNPFDSYGGTTFLGEWQGKFKIAGRPTGMIVTGTYSVGQKRLRITEDPRILIQDYLTGGSLAVRKDSWSLMWNGYHYLFGDEAQGWGLFGRFGFSDGDPNPVRWAASGGIGGVGPFASRELDRWGVGVFFHRFTDQGLVAAAGISEEIGGEVFYSLHLAPGTRLTFDFQAINSAIPGLKTTLVGGARVAIDF